MLSFVCSVTASLDMSISSTPSLGSGVDELPDRDDADTIIEPSIMKNMKNFTMPQMNRPHSTASTSLKKSFVFIFLKTFCLSFVCIICKFSDS